MMKRVSCLVAMWCAVALVCAAAFGQQVETIVTHMPEGCSTFRSQSGDTLSVHYTLTLDADGKKVDSSLDRGQPFEFTLGSGMVIKGWEIGMDDMCEGEKRTLIIPPELGYGNRDVGRGMIPANSVLRFETELLKIKNRRADEL
ncbi:FK506-binding protein 2 [Porphyridium purpureum]|uniref:peptidylprolyl isomerase n=1 Tax=Porphyridium purpureum TaxID=35688 RepID=A0A5J4YSZ9_PORPP|nr:FK506-binding protein 2 [Porphyridium purpureum]|eukprot:POR6684..scf227_4